MTFGGTLTLTAGGKIAVTLPGESFTSGVGNSGTPTAQTAGTPFNITLTAVQSDGVTIDTSYSGAKTISYNGPGGSPSYTTSVNFTGGQAADVATTLTLAQTTTLSATDGTLTGIPSSSLTVNPSAIDSYLVTASSQQLAGSLFNVTVTAKDAHNNTVTTDNTTVVTMTSGSGNVEFDSDGNNTFGDNTKTLTAGTFTIIAKNDSLETTTITATDGNSKTGTSGSIKVSVLLAEENFDYPENDNITAHGWTAHSSGGTSPIKVQSPGLTFGTYASSGIGPAASLVTSGEDDNKPFATQTGGIVYAAFLVAVSNATTGGDYFFHFFENSSAFHGRIYIQKDASSSSFAFGLGRTNESATYTGFNYDLNTTYLVVLKYAFNEGPANDTVALYLNPASGGSEPTPTIGPLTYGPLEAVNINAVALRQGGATTAPSVLVDAIRVATTWADAVNHTPVANDDVTEVQLGAPVTIAAAKLLANDTDADSDTLTITGASAAAPGASVSVVGGDLVYTPPASGSSDTITYTISDGHGATDTANITVTLLAAPSEQGFNKLLVEGSVMTYLGIPGQSYVLEYTALLSPASWGPVITNQAAINGYLRFTNSQSGFFRTKHLSAP